MGYPLSSTPREQAKELIKQRDAIEREIEELTYKLTAEQNSPGLNGNLLDADRFPRSDIDIVQVRMQRNRLATLRTDHKTLTDKIESLLHVVLAKSEDSAASDIVDSARGAGPVGTSEGARLDAQRTERRAPLRVPFALVDEVSTNGPAFAAGLLVGDKILAVGPINYDAYGTSQSAMRVLPSFIREHRNREVQVKVARLRAPSRGGEVAVIDLTLTPREWGGNGLLGCHITTIPQRKESGAVVDVATAALDRVGP